MIKIWTRIVRVTSFIVFLWVGDECTRKASALWLYTETTSDHIRPDHQPWISMPYITSYSLHSISQPISWSAGYGRCPFLDYSSFVFFLCYLVCYWLTVNPFKVHLKKRFDFLRGAVLYLFLFHILPATCSVHRDYICTHRGHLVSSGVGRTGH